MAIPVAGNPQLVEQVLAACRADNDLDLGGLLLIGRNGDVVRNLQPALSRAEHLTQCRQAGSQSDDAWLRIGTERGVLAAGLQPEVMRDGEQDAHRSNHDSSRKSLRSSE